MARRPGPREVPLKILVISRWALRLYAGEPRHSPGFAGISGSFAVRLRFAAGHGMKIGIVGAGVSGLVAAYRLRERHDVTLFESNRNAGGHVNTVDVEVAGVRHAIDTGFIVFNEATYPHFSALLQELGVASQPTSMSFSVTDAATGYEYGSRSLSALFAQPANLANRTHLRMLADIVRFNRRALAELPQLTEEQSVREFCRRHRLSRGFVERYLYPLGSAIWSCPRGTFENFPVRFIVEFFRQHGLLALVRRPTWRVIVGGARNYVAALTRELGSRLRLGVAVERVVRRADAVEISLQSGQTERFDHVIFACHSDHALGILGGDATVTEREVLSAFPYQENRAVLHTDESLLPRSRRAWASWNYRILPTDAATVTYNLNLLQGLRAPQTFCVTLNDAGTIDPTSIIRTFRYAHPVFTTGRAAAQARHGELLNCRRTSFCGAYWRNGFHEDGVVSALAVVDALQHRQRGGSQPTAPPVAAALLGELTR
jgi:predicted NAD/FAD-binding protein